MNDEESEALSELICESCDFASPRGTRRLHEEYLSSAFGFKDERGDRELQFMQGLVRTSAEVQNLMTATEAATLRGETRPVTGGVVSSMAPGRAGGVYSPTTGISNPALMAVEAATAGLGEAAVPARTPATSSVPAAIAAQVTGLPSIIGRGDEPVTSPSVQSEAPSSVRAGAAFSPVYTVAGLLGAATLESAGRTFPITMQQFPMAPSATATAGMQGNWPAESSPASGNVLPNPMGGTVLPITPGYVISNVDPGFVNPFRIRPRPMLSTAEAESSAHISPLNTFGAETRTGTRLDLA